VLQDRQTIALKHPEGLPEFPSAFFKENAGSVPAFLSVYKALFVPIPPQWLIKRQEKCLVDVLVF